MAEQSLRFTSAEGKAAVNLHEGRLRDVDAVRGLAAVVVVLYHFTTRYDELYGHLAGVPFFVGKGTSLLIFMLTGFAIAVTVRKGPVVAQFISARVIRLFPAYWAAVLLTHEVVARFGLPGREVDGGVTVANLTMLQQFIGMPNVDGSYWTLEVQIVFYAGVCLFLALRPRASLLRFSAVWLLTLFALSSFDRLVYQMPSEVKAIAILDFGHLFLAGAMFYLLRTEPQSRNSSLCVIGGCALYGFLFQDPAMFKLSLVFFALMYLLATKRLSWLASRPLDYVAAISYTLYLVHQNIGFVVIRLAYAHGVTSPTLAIVIAIAVSVVLAVALTLLIERPIARVRNRKAAADAAANEGAVELVPHHAQL
jgi:peptidoglycan/LPS O-acetylase OafA/YrhL